MSLPEYLEVFDNGNDYYVTIKHIIHPNAVIYKKGELDNDYTKLGTTKDNTEMSDASNSKEGLKENTFFIKNEPKQYLGGGRKSKRSRKSYSSKKRALKSRRIRKSSRRYSRRR